MVPHSILQFQEAATAGKLFRLPLSRNYNSRILQMIMVFEAIIESTDGER